jgi:hypothetical protein
MRIYHLVRLSIRRSNRTTDKTVPRVDGCVMSLPIRIGWSHLVICRTSFTQLRSRSSAAANASRLYLRRTSFVCCHSYLLLLSCERALLFNEKVSDELSHKFDNHLISSSEQRCSLALPCLFDLQIHS